jgi:hypothetical protein
LEETIFPLREIKEDGGSMFLNNIVTHITLHDITPCSDHGRDTIMKTSILTKYMFASSESSVLFISK